MEKRKNKDIIGKWTRIKSKVSKHNGMIGRICGNCQNGNMVYVYFGEEKKKVLFMIDSLELLH